MKLKLKILASEDNATLEDAFNVWFCDYELVDVKELSVGGCVWMFIYYK